SSVSQKRSLMSPLLFGAVNHAARPRSMHPDPKHKITLFALFSTRRESEIARAKHTDLDPETSRLFIKDMKHPGKKAGNDVWCDLPTPALQVAQSMKPIKSKVEKKRALIFGTSKDVISRRWTEACRMLGIADLVFHDLRHEGISRLFEMGETIPQVAAVSGHRSWASMQRYTHLQTRGDRYEDWEWIQRVTKT
ncbi:tyrosine-type recombinase/integrase, partial [Tritonibacter mobilis]|uniref:tyrosine-type recombinase/integrase n=3 Tax=Tritonibacter mobilis TaxID=379347 RepID=UPI0008994C8B